MQVLLNTDANIDGGRAMADHVESVVKDALDRFAEHVTRVDAHLTDANSRQKTHPDEIHCTLEAKLIGLEPVVAKDHANTAHQAIRGATGKLQRAIGAALAKHDSRRHAASLSDREGTDPRSPPDDATPSGDAV
jgi:ribosomal subunit interface protein